MAEEIVLTALELKEGTGFAAKLTPGNYVIFVDQNSFDMDAFSKDRNWPESWGEVDTLVLGIKTYGGRTVSDCVKLFKVEKVNG